MDENTIEKQRYIFGSIFLLSNRLQTIGDRYLKDITTKQWFLMVVIGQFGDHEPTLSEVAKEMGTSRQNLKQIATKLQDKGFLRIRKDENDSRILRLSITEKSEKFWEGRIQQDIDFINNLFVGITPKELDEVYSGFNKILNNVLRTGEEFND